MKPFLLSSLFILFCSSSSARDIITPSTPLADNETLISSDGTFALGFFTPPDSNSRYVGLWYNLIPDQTILWVANRESPLVNSPGLLSITRDGRLTISNQNSIIVWSTKARKGLNNTIAQLLDSGNLVVKQSGENYAWQGFDFLTDTLIPGMKLGVDFISGINHTLTVWKNYNDPSSGAYHVYMGIKGIPELYFSNGTNMIWSSGAWFSGAPVLTSLEGFSFSLVNTASEVTLSYSSGSPKFLWRLLANSTGVLQLALWTYDQWRLYWSAPIDQCDNFGECGPYGVCDPNNMPICSCLKGFVPKNPPNRNLRDGREGCVRNARLDCDKNTGGFMQMSNVKLPGSENAIGAIVPSNLLSSSFQCKDLCLSNCNCTAYATGDGCIIWEDDLYDIRQYIAAGRQDLYIRLAAIDLGAPPAKPQKSRIKAVAIIVSLVFGIPLLSCICCFLWKRKRRPGVKDQSNEMDGENGLYLPLVDFHTIVSATDNFSAENKLGQGGFGPVYKPRPHSLKSHDSTPSDRRCSASPHRRRRSPP